jgi:solute:Na+ symporter, SSS family
MILTPIDWIIILAYVALTIGVGLIYAKRAGSSIEEYFVSGRSLPWWIAGTSMVATGFAADTPLAVTGLVARHGLAGNWFWWAFAMGGMITVFVYARMWRRAGVMTDVELVELRYGGTPAAALRGMRAVYVAAIVNPIIIGWVTAAILTVFRVTILKDMQHTFWTDLALVVVLFAAVGIYSTLSGMWGVAITDVIQFVLAMIGCTWLAVVAVGHVGGVDALVEKVNANFGSDELFRFIPRFDAADAWMPLHIFLILIFIQWWATWYPGSEPGGGGYVVQRMAACKNEAHALGATLWYQLAYYCLRPWPWLMVAFVALVMFPELRTDLGKDGVNPDVGYPMVMAAVSPVGLRGLLIVTFLAAFMSTISTQMNWGASYLVRDLYQRFRAPEASEKQIVRASRIASIAVMVLGIVSTMIMRDVSVDTAWSWLAALGAGTGLVFMLRWFWWRINAWSEISAMFASLVFFLAFDPIAAAIGWKDPASQEKMACVAIATIFVWLLTTFMTPAESVDTLSAFFRKVRPGGPGWKPIAKKCPDVDADRRIGYSFLAALFATGVVYFTLPAVGFLIFKKYGAAGGCMVGAAVCGLATLSIVVSTQISIFDDKDQSGSAK